MSTEVNFPKEIWGQIIFGVGGYYTPPQIWTESDVKTAACKLLPLAYVEKTCHQACQRALADLKETFRLIQKYHPFRNDSPINNVLIHKFTTPPPSCLLGALKCLDTYISYIIAKDKEERKNQIVDDIHHIVRLMPTSIYSPAETDGPRIRIGITPLFYATRHAAFADADAVWLSIVELLLKNNANPNSTFLFNWSHRAIERHIFKDLSIGYGHVPQFQKLKQLFKQYGLSDDYYLRKETEEFFDKNAEAQERRLLYVYGLDDSL